MLQGFGWIFYDFLTSNFSWRRSRTNNCWEPFSHPSATLQPSWRNARSYVSSSCPNKVERQCQESKAYDYKDRVWPSTPHCTTHSWCPENWSDLDHLGIMTRDGNYHQVAWHSYRKWPIHTHFINAAPICTYLILFVPTSWKRWFHHSCFFFFPPRGYRSQLAHPPKKAPICSLASALAWKNRITVAAFGAGNHRQGMPLLLASVPRRGERETIEHLLFEGTQKNLKNPWLLQLFWLDAW